MPVKPNREYRAAAEAFTVREQQPDAEEKEYIVEGYASTFTPYALYSDGTNTVYERIDEHAFDEADFSDCCFLFNHTGRVFARTRNNLLQCTVDDHGLKVTADLSRTPAARDIWEDIKAGNIDQMSFAFTIAEDELDKASRTRTVKRIAKVYDVSAVTLPANPDTAISARDYFNGVLEAERRESAEKLELEKLRTITLMEMEDSKL